MRANRAAAYRLLQHGAEALAEVEAAGMRVDRAYIRHQMAAVDARVATLADRLRGCEEYRLQRRRYGDRTNLTSRDQLAAVLFDDMGHTAHTRTATGRPQLDETALERIGTRYARGFLRLEKLNKLNSTYLRAIDREAVGEFIHAFFGLHTTRSYRGSSDSPNLQNIPVRDPMVGPIIRRAFIPRPGHVLVEFDYGSLEVMIACALSGDPRLTYDATEGDMHRDMAAECYMLGVDGVTKPTRQAAKGGFVFAEFYGDWYKQVTINLWDAIDRNGLRTPEGVGLRNYLASCGITDRGRCDPSQRDPTPGTFEAHIRAVEKRFWGERFHVYAAKRKAWVAEYERQGYIDLVTGFRCGGPMTRNQVMNYHIQGPSFHCLLWSLIQTVRELRRGRWRSMVVGTVHDSIIADVHEAELPDYLALVADITTRRLRAAWPWVTVPLTVEAEVGPNWYDKKPVEIPT